MKHNWFIQVIPIETRAKIPLFGLCYTQITDTIVSLMVYRYWEQAGIQLFNFVEQEKMLSFNQISINCNIVNETIPFILFVWHESSPLSLLTIFLDHCVSSLHDTLKRFVNYILDNCVGLKYMSLMFLTLLHIMYLLLLTV